MDVEVKVEKLENAASRIKITVEVPAEEFEKAMQQAYLKERGKISVQGFRKGRAPRQIIEKMYGSAVFYEEAANICIDDAYPEAVEQIAYEIVSRPEIDLVQIGKGQSLIFTAEVAVKPEVTLGEYKGVEVTKHEVLVTEADVDAELDKVRRQNSRLITIEDRPVEDGDHVTIDFEGFRDGVPFEGGKGEDYALTIGSHTFIDTFEEQLIGHSIGDDVTVNVTFPENYQPAELAGQPAVFEVKIKNIRMEELPELDDDFAEDVSDFDTLEEYREDIFKKLKEERGTEAKNAMESEAIEKIVAATQMDIPDEMIRNMQQQMKDDYSDSLQRQGLRFEQYLSYMQIEEKDFLEQLKPQATKRVQARLVLEQIAKEEEIEVTEEEIEAEIQKIADAYHMDIDTVREQTQAVVDDIRRDIEVQKAYDIIMEHVVYKEAAE
ncbi:MAG: trigger factor [Lachnospiraceae bacterium]|nr:trigger factor [Lachnospiraceae bacterium]